MLLDRVLPLFAGFFGVMALGVALRTRLRDPLSPPLVAAALTAVIIDVTAPALTLDVLLRARIAPSLFVALAPATLALAATLGLALLAARALRLPRPQAGALALCASFCNTGFVGLPVIQGLYVDDPRAAQAAVVIDSCDTTLLLWTVGVAVAARFGANASADDGGLRALARRPVTWAVFAGFALNAVGVTLPGWLRPGVEHLGAATGPLVFLTLGLSVDVAKLRGRGALLASAVAAKLVLSPAVALAAVFALGMRGPAASATVLQAAMPTAPVSVMIATRQGCDGALASAIATLSMLLATATLPAWFALTEALLR